MCASCLAEGVCAGQSNRLQEGLQTDGTAAVLQGQAGSPPQARTLIIGHPHLPRWVPADLKETKLDFYPQSSEEKRLMESHWTPSGRELEEQRFRAGSRMSKLKLTIQARLLNFS